jgi:hypothetical protein
MTLLWLGAAGACISVLVWFGAQRLREQKRAQKERSQLLAVAYTWGLSSLPGEANDALRERIRAASSEGASSDPLETAARALRAQRERRSSQTGSTRDSLRRT